MMCMKDISLYNTVNEDITYTVITLFVMTYIKDIHGNLNLGLTHFLLN